MSAEPNRSSSSFAIDDRSAKAGGYYLGNSHELIHRHLEQITLAADDSARWQLTVDFELPSDPDARCGSKDGECLFLFPLVFLKKAEGRTGFGAKDESGASIPLPTRSTCDWVSALAAAEAAARLEAGRQPQGAVGAGGPSPSLPQDDLSYALQCVASMRPFDASVVLSELLARVDPSVTEAWADEGLSEDLKMLVEHWLLWMPVRGLPGERRQISIGQDVELLPRPFFRWCVGKVDVPPDAVEEPDTILDTGTGQYGKIGWRVDFSVLGERIALPFAWMPIDFDFPTIYTRRCTSYHFEIVCPSGLSPRGVKIADRPGLDEDDEDELDVSETMGRRAGIAYLPQSRTVGDLMVRATVGIGQGAFPSLWLLMGSITSVMLWYLVGAHPTELIDEPSGNKAQIAAGILLIVPAALLGAIAIVEGSIARLIGGARLLLLVTGLASVGAATVLIGREPLGLSPVTRWSICAGVATVATVPLATSWLLSLPLIGRLMQRLDSVDKQYRAFDIAVAVAVVLTAGLLLADDCGAARACIALALLFMAVPLSLLATDRLQVPIVATRNFLSFGTIFAAIVCVAIACIELHTALVAKGHTPLVLELVAIVLLVLSTRLGYWLRRRTSRFHEKLGEVHIAPTEAKALLAGRRVRELLRLRSPVRDEEHGPASSTEGNLSWGVRSTVHLPDHEPGEFEHVRKRWPREEESGARWALESEAREVLPDCMARLERARA